MAIRTDIQGHIGEVVLDQPPVNALDSKSWNELADVISALGARAEVRCLLVRARARDSAPASTSRKCSGTPSGSLN